MRIGYSKEDQFHIVWRELKEKVYAKPALLKEVICLLDKEMEDLDDKAIDFLLGCASDEFEQSISQKALKKQFGIEQYVYEGTPYNYIRRFLETLNPTSKDTVYDLGSGYGRIVLYGAMTTPAYFKGIEIAPERVKQAEKITQFFQIERAEFIQGNVLDHDYSDGTIFFLFNPFIHDTLAQVGEKLKSLSQKEKIKIASWGGSSTTYFLNQDWLEELKLDRDHITNGITGLKIFSSKSR